MSILAVCLASIPLLMGTPTQALMVDLFPQPVVTVQEYQISEVPVVVEPEYRYDDSIIGVVNFHRKSMGLNPLIESSELNEMADIRAKEIVDVWSHTRPDGTHVGILAKSRGFQFSTIGENLAYGQSSVSRAFDEWMASPGHKANLEKSYWVYTGSSVFTYNGKNYYVQLFSK